MSAWAGDPDHFVRRYEAEGGHRRGFAERRLYGRYLGELLDEAEASGKVEPVDAVAIAARRTAGRWQVELDDGSAVAADAVALAIGNQEPDTPRAFAEAGQRFIANPWGSAAADAVQDVAATSGDVLIVGTGLTMVDLVLSLDAAGHRGSILALSRRGLVPRGHADYEPAPVGIGEVPRGSLAGLWRWLRRRSGEVGWRAAVDSLRPHSHALWQSLDILSQKRFLRHARPWWDVHRHRIAPEVAARMMRLIGEGRLRVMAGRVLSVVPKDEGLRVEARPRGAAAARVMTFAYAFNCTGPLQAIARTRDPLLRSLLERQEVRPDHLGIDLAVGDGCRAGERLWALGPLTKGRYWEIIAVPDIREQAAMVANEIERELER